MSQATDLHTKMLPAYQIDIAAAPIQKKGRKMRLCGANMKILNLYFYAINSEIHAHNSHSGEIFHISRPRS